MTESVLLRRDDRIRADLTELKNMGISLAIVKIIIRIAKMLGSPILALHQVVFDWLDAVLATLNT